MPEQIVLNTVFLLKSPQDDLTAMDNTFLRFLAANKLEYSGPTQRSWSSDDYAYTYPAYQITLSPSTYRLVEAYRDQHPELSGWVLSRRFAKHDRDAFVQKVIGEARQKAQEQANKQGLTLLETYEMEELPVEKQGWVVYPPLSARINHFHKAALDGRYRFSFAVR